MRSTYRDGVAARTTKAAALALIGAAALAVARRLLQGLGMTSPSRGPRRTAEQLTPDEMDRLRAFAMRKAGDPEAARFRAEVEADRAAGIPPEQLLGHDELLARKRSVRQA